jgi:hypothetical protein
MEYRATGKKTKGITSSVEQLRRTEREKLRILTNEDVKPFLNFYLNETVTLRSLVGRNVSSIVKKGGLNN